VKGPKRQIQSVKRATDILNLFIDESRPLGITDFSRRLGLPKATISGIVSTLVSAGFLEKYPFTAKYRLGPQLFHLGMKCTTNTDLVAVVRTWLERLCLQFNLPVNMGMLINGSIKLVVRIEPGNRYTVFPQGGLVIPLHTTSLGKTLMSYLDTDKRDLILDGYQFEKLTGNSITDREGYLEELAQVKSSGISFDNEETIVGMTAIGGPMFNQNGEVIAAFSIAGCTLSVTKNRNAIIEAVRYTSLQVSKQLGVPDKTFS
jgi:DNA-binding IclR family transcriptional regulator